MKKIISSLLIAILLLGTLSSCSVKYSESAWSDDLNEKTLHGVSFTEDLTDAMGYKSSIFAMSNASHTTEGEKKDLRTVNLSSKRDYYTCAYLDRETVKLIEENPGFSTSGTFWSGKNFYITFYRELFHKGMIDAKKNPIHWIEIPVEEEIPEKYNGMMLAMICESYEATVTDLVTGESEKREAFYELFELYGQSPSMQYNKYRDTHFPSDMLVYDSFDYGENILTMIELYDIRYYHGLEIKTIDGIDYVCSSIETNFATYDYVSGEYGTVNLTQTDGYRNIDGVHYFALEDLAEIYLTYNIKPAE